MPHPVLSKKFELKWNWIRILNWNWTEKRIEKIFWIECKTLLLKGITCACSVVSLVHQTDEIKIINARFTWDNHESRISWTSGVILVESSWRPLKNSSFGPRSLRRVICSIRNHQIRNCHRGVPHWRPYRAEKTHSHFMNDGVIEVRGGVAWLIKASLTRRNSLACSSIIVPFLTCRQKLAQLLVLQEVHLVLGERWNG